jgi:colicin import membrane protein
VSAKGLAAIRRRSEAWLAARAKLRAQLEEQGRLRHRDDEGGASTQAHRDRVELLREIDWRDGLIEELRSEAPRLRKERDEARDERDQERVALDNLRCERMALQSLIEELRKERDEARDARDEALIRASTWIERADAAEARGGSKAVQLEDAFRRLGQADERARAADRRAAEAEAQKEDALRQLCETRRDLETAQSQAALAEGGRRGK